MKKKTIKKVKKINYGFKPDVITSDQHIFGASSPFENLQSNGQWDDYLPVAEYQNLNGVEPYACVSFGTLSACEILLKRKLQRIENFSDRFLAKISGTSVGGNSPHTVCEYLRKVGSPFQERWDFTPDIDTFEKFYAPIPPKLFDYAKDDFLNRYQFKHDWVFQGDYPLEVKQQGMIAALQSSPLGVSVYAWLEKDGMYYKPEWAEDNHWTVCYGYEYGKYWKIFDSYSNEIKKVAWNTDFSFCKRFYLAPITAKKPWWQTLFSWFFVV